MSNELTKPEVTTLGECENVIEAGQRTFIDVGQALLKIRDSRLYRAEHDTFENYCVSRWGWSKSRANQLVDAAKAAANLTTTVVTPPASERVVRPLTHLEPAQQREAWEKANEKAAAEDRPVSARHVEGAVIELAPRVRREKFTMPTQAMFLARGAVSQLCARLVL